MIRPLNDRVVCRRVDPEKVTKGGIVIPDASQGKSRVAKVLAVGPGKLLESGERSPLETKVGDIIYLGPFAGQDITIDGTEYVFVSENEIMGVEQ